MVREILNVRPHAGYRHLVKIAKYLMCCAIAEGVAIPFLQKKVI
jgi:hypothetical protein